ncbi:hypothetical protein N7495_006380 [Penicillium taxi]|uniref:uncharacterized protein n=1 Tax=Penicillium taxi TaxID=168475 RepID=UPI002544FFDB|nr:uncharacterized protein N7495_006380 [Penicillium taxi]KAJ5894689.1 hypothetical protein N7495_006380 [Penicillium taxi]
MDKNTSIPIGDIDALNALRKEVREAIQKDPWNLDDNYRSGFRAAKQNLHQLWLNVSNYDNSTNLNACESIWTANTFISFYDTFLPNDGGPRTFQGEEAEAVLNMFTWAVKMALPSSEFAANFDDNLEITEGIYFPAQTGSELPAKKGTDIQKAQNETRLRAKLATEFILQLEIRMNPCFEDRSATQTSEAIVAIISYHSAQDPWTAGPQAADITQLSDQYLTQVMRQKDVMGSIEKILREIIKPLFTKTRNPALTSEGRKNLYPLPLPHFDGSTFDDSAKPWKNTNIYATTVLSWIISQYKSTHKAQLEAHFPLLVPALLALIDDSNTYYKAKGCLLLKDLLKPIQESGSDIIVRTNLNSVFVEAITPCLLSLPTITPENKSLQILSGAYNALLSVLKATYKTKTPGKTRVQIEKDDEAYTTAISKILRTNVIASFHQISSSTGSISTSASFPYPKLSEILMSWIYALTNELGIHTVKYLQDIIPVLYSTLASPFGPDHPAMILGAILCTKTVILNAHPRMRYWRGEIFGGLSACWLHVNWEEDEVANGSARDSAVESKWPALKTNLKDTVTVLKHALQNPPQVVDQSKPENVLTAEKMDKELQDLVDADPKLKDLLL